MASPISITLDEVKTVVAWAERALKRGLKPQELQPSIDDPAQLDRILRYIRNGAPEMQEFPGIVFDAEKMCRILDKTIRANGPCPTAAPGTRIVYCDGWTLQDLRCSKAGLEKMWQDQDWYDTFAWKAEPGYYEVLLPVPFSNNMTMEEEVEHLHRTYPGFEPAPVPVADTALLAEYAETGKDPLSGNIIRCAEQTRPGFRVVLRVLDGRVCVNCHWGDYRSGHVFLAAARRISS